MNFLRLFTAVQTPEIHSLRRFNHTPVMRRVGNRMIMTTHGDTLYR